MEISKIDRCCCFSLETGTIIIGFLKILNYLIFYAILVFNYDVCKYASDLCFGTTELATVWKLFYHTLGSILLPLLIYGSIKEEHKLMTPFLVFEAVRIIVEVSVFIFWTGKLIAHDFFDGFFYFIIGMVILSLLAYFWIVLYNRKCEIKSFDSPSYKKSIEPYDVNC